MAHKLPQHVIALAIVDGLTESGEYQNFIEALHSVWHERPAVYAAQHWPRVNEAFPFIDDESGGARGAGSPHQCGAFCISGG
jgi:hypothetical protein